MTTRRSETFRSDRETRAGDPDGRQDVGDERAAGDGTSIDTAARRGRLSTGWLSQASRLEAMLAPVDDPLLASAAPALAESVLDVGCEG